MKWNPYRGPVITSAVFDSTITIFRVLDTMSEHSLLIQSWILVGGSYAILCNFPRHIWQYLEMPQWVHLGLFWGQGEGDLLRLFQCMQGEGKAVREGLNCLVRVQGVFVYG